MAAPRVPGYEVQARLGAGASAQVWRARRQADDLEVALKVVTTGADQVSRALREAGVLSRVHHEHVVHLYDVLPVPGPDGRPDGVALAMQLAEGGSLAGVLAAREHLTPGELVTIASPLAGALADLHRAGVVHGDLSAGNVLFLADGMPLLSDLGASRIAGEGGAAHGTDGMVAPEVLEGFPPTAESDVYALGALAWRCLVGEPPGWVGTRSGLAELLPELPEQVVSVVTSALAAEPVERPEAEELAVALFAMATPEPVTLAPDADPAAGLTRRIRADLRRAREPRDGTEPDPVRAPLWRRVPGRLGLVLAGGVSLALVALLVGPWLGSLVQGGTPGAATRPAAVTAEASGAAVRGAEAVAAPGASDAAGATSGDPSGDESHASEEPMAGGSAAAAASPDLAGQLTDPRATVQELLDSRAAAWRSGDPTGLGAVHVADSPAYQQERDSLASAQDLQISYTGLEFRVGDVDVLASGPERAVLQVEVARSAYQAVTADGATTHDHRSDVIELELRRADGDWRIWGWQAARQP